MGQFRVSAKDIGQARRKAMRMRKGSTITKVNFIGDGTGQAKGKKMFAITAKRARKALKARGMRVKKATKKFS